ncbi:MAG: hypothetical protein BWX83_00753 [Candidatus Cloacimonetes bacterium ADurb.Bin117]|nr:MAG: hypothetical protein BWX83_00753 [Candidatus Cloacimonetes bacterium ADurb.Bin117]
MVEFDQFLYLLGGHFGLDRGQFFLEFAVPLVAQAGHRGIDDLAGVWVFEDGLLDQLFIVRLAEAAAQFFHRFFKTQRFQWVAAVDPVRIHRPGVIKPSRPPGHLGLTQSELAPVEYGLDQFFVNAILHQAFQLGPDQAGQRVRVFPPHLFADDAESWLQQAFPQGKDGVLSQAGFENGLFQRRGRGSHQNAHQHRDRVG